MVRKYFGTEGIRGRANGTITPEMALKVGQAAGLIFRRGEHRVLIGKDTRLSGYMIETALVAGFTSVGMDVFQTGPMPTPAVAMLTHSMRADLGVMISASHNPYDDNGIKLFGPDGFKLSDEIEHKIEELIDSELVKMLAKSADLGRARRIDDGQGRYVEFAKRTLPRNLSFDGLRVVVDCANGAAYRVAPQALWELGAEVISLGVDPDGFNINRECGSTEPAALCQKVKEMRADIGIALDGDGDHVLIADERGHIVDGDQLLAVVAESWKADGRLVKPGIVATVMSNLGLERYLVNLDLSLARTPSAIVMCLSTCAPMASMLGRVVRPHLPVRLHHDRRRPAHCVAGAGGGEKARAAGVQGVPSFRSVAASAQERALRERQAARECQGAYRHKGCAGPPRWPWSADCALVGHRAGDPRHGGG
jgi:phosphoglucosamine mutase